MLVTSNVTFKLIIVTTAKKKFEKKLITYLELYSGLN